MHIYYINIHCQHAHVDEASHCKSDDTLYKVHCNTLCHDHLEKIDCHIQK